MSRVDIAAGGYGTRIREFMVEVGHEPDFPKHLLPTGGPEGETLLGRIVRQSFGAPMVDSVVIHANDNNAGYFVSHPDVDTRADVITGNYGRSLDPFFGQLVEAEERVLGCAGDFYADFSWQELLSWHDAHSFAVSFVVGHSAALDGGAIFDVAENGKIERLRRAKPNQHELINVGIYVIDPTELVIGAATRHMENTGMTDETIVNELIDLGVAGAYLLEGTPYNVNTASTYQALLDHTSSLSVRTSQREIA